MKPFRFNLLVVPVLLSVSCTDRQEEENRSDVPVAPARPEKCDEGVASTIRLHVRDFGAVPSSENIFQALEKVIAAAKATDGPVEILFEPDAQYRIMNPKAEEARQGPVADQFAFHITNATNLTINGQGATLIVTDPNIGAISMDYCSHTDLRNFKIDYDPLPFTQGVITKVNMEEQWLEMRLDDGYPEPDTVNFQRSKEFYLSNWGLTVRDEGNGRVRYGPAAVFMDKWEKAEECRTAEQTNKEFRSEVRLGQSENRDQRERQRIPNNEGRSTETGRIWRFHAPVDSEKYKLYATQFQAAGLKVGDRFVYMARNWSQAVRGLYGDHILWEGITIYTSPGLDFFPRGTSHHTIRDCHVMPKEGRIFSATSDGIHARGSRGNLLIEDCSFDGMADDGINVHSSALSVVAVPAPDQIVVNKHTFGVRPGDELIQVRPVTAAVTERVFVKTVQDQGSTWRVTLTEALADGAVGDNFYNLSESAAPFVIRNCHFKNYRGRGVLVSAHGGIIENCTFEMPEGWGVVLHYETTRWAEGPLAYDLKVLNNTFLGKGSAILPAIRTEITTPGGEEVEGRPFHNLLIEGNRFHDYGQPVMNIHHARNIIIRDNRVFCSDKMPRKKADYAAIELFDCENVTIEKLAVEDAKAGAAVKIAADCEEIKVDTESLKLDISESGTPVQALR